ncbi:MAG: hypothetical protein CML66_27285 [Rhodobacteraceae bacterium]|nr:hypothetical protein [Paracoccaceae bacterium]MAY45047.1 hypothetical protein [Paracoccaceae bacterium]
MTRPAARTLTPVLLVAAMGLAACSGWSDSRVNPGNWFGRSRAAEVSPELAATEVNPLMPEKASDFVAGERAAVEGVLINQVTNLVIERTVEGAIIRAEGLATREGAYDARLIPVSDTEEPVDGVLSYRFEVKYPNEATPQGNQNARTIVVARSVTAQHIDTARVVRVTGAQNARETSRR